MVKGRRLHKSMKSRRQGSLEDILEAAYYSPVASDPNLTKTMGNFLPSAHLTSQCHLIQLITSSLKH